MKVTTKDQKYRHLLSLLQKDKRTQSYLKKIEPIDCRKIKYQTVRKILTKQGWCLMHSMKYKDTEYEEFVHRNKRIILKKNGIHSDKLVGIAFAELVRLTFYDDNSYLHSKLIIETD